MLQPAASAIVLYGRASFDKAQGLPAMAGRLAPTLPPGTRVAWAFADLTGPSLPDVLDALAAEGVREAIVVTCMVPADPTHATWLAGALSQWSADRGAQVAVRLAPAIEAALDLPAAIRDVLGRPAAEVTLTPPSLGKPGWSKIPEHGRQIFFCVGARCLHRGAEPLYQHLRNRMKQHRPLAAGPRRAMCARSSCLYPCNLGPLMIVYPDGHWYGGLTRDGIDRIVSDHLLSDRPVAEGIVHRTTADGAVGG
ncbi:(2Fe-2S) ferredoxin domain-containing protein [Enterovirga aerilata]|uniref:(2Fe-2S) ferredoxin domain-containing protein n=1 Tax=Enterovirga aerilata TaxID=2730920 RepID=A0A849I349_9HYPH|nr:CbiX/SirB N-terminal domain-containing protein [Enterovirga sp. DB1703]NNM71788.1 (2Fe-2S) ferredoxin domain-containing protein [Enterovirga sp. DB1703]